MQPWLVGAALVAALNAVSFAQFGLDKRRARTGTRRIPERTLLTWAAVSGTLGAWSGMRVFRHKTRKPRFIRAMLAITALDATAVIAAVAVLR